MTYFWMVAFNKVTEADLFPEIIIPSTGLHTSWLVQVHVCMAKVSPLTYSRA